MTIEEERDKYKELLNEARVHLHWLTVGGDFAYEVEQRSWSLGSFKEYDAAREFKRKLDKLFYG
jgi:hypothetical protein